MNQDIYIAFSLLREGRTNDGVELLYRKCYAQMYGMAFSVLKDENDSRDALHNVIAKLLSTSTEKLPHINELGWLYTVIKNESLDFLKSKTRIVLDDEFLSDFMYEDEAISSMINNDVYHRMISSLDKERQAVVTLKVLGGFTHREIAEILGKPMGTVQWLYATAILKLKATIPILSTISLLTSAETVRRIIKYMNALADGPTDIPGEGLPPIDNIPPDDIPNMSPPMDDIGGVDAYIPFDYWICIFGVIALLSILTLILVCFRNYKRKKK